MPLISIATLDDLRFEPYRELKRTNRTRWANEFIVESELLVERLLASRFPVRSILMAEHRRPAWETRLQKALPEVPIYVLPSVAVSELVGFKFHRGLMACAARADEPPLNDILGRLGDQVTLIACPDTRDPENLGSIFRTAAALGASGVIVGAHGVDPLSRRVLRVSMGASLSLPWRRALVMRSELLELRDAWGFELVAAVLDPAAETIDSFATSARSVLLVGNEAHGLDPELLALCGRRVSIPMADGVDSLNVAVATGILLYHVLRVRGLGPSD